MTGSSSLSLAAGTREALTGRTWSYVLYPIAFEELRELESSFELEGRLPEALVLGMYPALFSLANRNDQVEHLRELANAYAGRHANSFFWRVYTGAEIDYIEERDGSLFAYEFKLRSRHSAPPPSFRQAYPSARFATIDTENWLPFVTQ